MRMSIVPSVLLVVGIVAAAAANGFSDERYIYQ